RNSAMLELKDQKKRNNQGIYNERLNHSQTNDHRSHDLAGCAGIPGNAFHCGGNAPSLSERPTKGCNCNAQAGGKSYHLFNAGVEPRRCCFGCKSNAKRQTEKYSEKHGNYENFFHQISPLSCICLMFFMGYSP